MAGSTVPQTSPSRAFTRPKPPSVPAPAAPQNVVSKYARSSGVRLPEAVDAGSTQKTALRPPGRSQVAWATVS